eukprot:GFUD01124211.1.p2 GENE.GFUD01124211.1~~GFUD01124211.1.p2  ORF type:complete len:113 (+),score=11.07 GFUD01124211.1:463-801(+)
MCQVSAPSYCLVEHTQWNIVEQCVCSVWPKCYFIVDAQLQENLYHAVCNCDHTLLLRPLALRLKAEALEEAECLKEARRQNASETLMFGHPGGTQLGSEQVYMDFNRTLALV